MCQSAYHDGVGRCARQNRELEIGLEPKKKAEFLMYLKMQIVMLTLELKCCPGGLAEFIVRWAFPQAALPCCAGK